MVDDDFQYTLGPPSSGFSIFLASRTKKVHFICHAEGFHNVATAETGTNHCLLRGEARAKDHLIYDTRIIPVGIVQTESLKEIIKIHPSVELLVFGCLMILLIFFFKVFVYRYY